jgi:GTPase
MADAREAVDESHEIFQKLRLKAPVIVVLNKIDAVKDPLEIEKIKTFFEEQTYCKEVVMISALKNTGVPELLQRILFYLPEGHPFYEGDDISDMPVKFFVGELVREKIFQLYHEELPYHTTVVVQEYKEKTTLTKIRAEIIVQRDTQKGIILGEGGSMIKQLGTAARKDIEEFIGNKVFLELYVKVRPKWRDSDMYLKEYGY